MNTQPFQNAEFLKKPSGAIIMDGKEVAHTIQCCHGGEHFVSIKGSGKRRGWCPNCKAMTCGRPECDPCVPYQEKLDLAEGASRTKSKNAEAIKRIESQYPNTIFF